MVSPFPPLFIGQVQTVYIRWLFLISCFFFFFFLRCENRQGEEVNSFRMRHTGPVKSSERAVSFGGGARHGGFVQGRDDNRMRLIRRRLCVRVCLEQICSPYVTSWPARFVFLRQNKKAATHPPPLFPSFLSRCHSEAPQKC